jgi:lysozyme family protein
MAKTNFSRALSATLQFEGGYVNHPADPGGATNMGITQRVLADWRGRSVTAADVKALTRAEAAGIYRRLYWEMVNCDSLPAGVDLAVFDYAVNSGVGRASRALQKVVGATVDGIVGRDTVAAAHAAGAAKVVAALCAERRGFLRRLRIFTVFGRGWLRRVAAVEALASGMAAKAVPPPVSFYAKELPMNFSKSIIESRTVWANIIGMAALGASVLGFDTSAVDQNAVIDAILKGIAGVGFVASTIFRIKATKKLG